MTIPILMALFLATGIISAGLFWEDVVMLNRTFALAMLFAGAAFAQTQADELKSKIGSVLYPPLAKAARVQGDVRLRLKFGVVTLLSGPPLLVRTAIESAKAFGSIPSEGDVDVTYHFVFAGGGTTSVLAPMTVKRGNAVGRAVLRMFGFKTEKVVLEYQCQPSGAPGFDLKISGANIEIWVYGRDGCLMTETATLIARRWRRLQGNSRAGRPLVAFQILKGYGRDSQVIVLDKYATRPAILEFHSRDLPAHLDTQRRHTPSAPSRQLHREDRPALLTKPNAFTAQPPISRNHASWVSSDFKNSLKSGGIRVVGIHDLPG
jgi:hypothetical protein